MRYSSISLNKSFSVSKLVMIYYFEYSSDFFFKGEQHDFFELLYVDNGTVEVISDNEKYKVEKGSFFLHAPNEFHALKACDNSSPTLVMISFLCEGESILAPLFRHGIKALSEEKVLVGKLVAETEQAFSNGLNMLSHKLRENKKAPFGAQQLISIYLEQLLIQLLRRHITAEGAAPHGVPARPQFEISLPQSKNIYVNEVLHYLLDNVGQALTIDQICRANKIGRSRIQELFHNEFSCGIMEYFILMKLNAAKSLLRSEGKSIGEIAELLGYSSQAYFTKQFKKAFNRSPSQYKQRVAHLTKKVSKPHTNS